MSKRPNAAKFIEVMTCRENVLKPDGECCLYFIQMYIESLDQNDLADFLFFVTGSTLIAKENRDYFHCPKWKYEEANCTHMWQYSYIHSISGFKMGNLYISHQ